MRSRGNFPELANDVRRISQLRKLISYSLPRPRRLVRPSSSELMLIAIANRGSLDRILEITCASMNAVFIKSYLSG